MMTQQEATTVRAKIERLKTENARIEAQLKESRERGASAADVAALEVRLRESFKALGLSDTAAAHAASSGAPGDDTARLEEAFRGLGLSERGAQIAIAGRRW